MVNLRNCLISDLSRRLGSPAESLEPLIGPHLVSDHILRLPKSVLSQAAEFVQAAWALRNHARYHEFLAPQAAALDIQPPGNASFAMSYDFHIDKSAQLKLIEINTNAAFFALGALCHDLQNTQSFSVSLSTFKQTLECELKMGGKSDQTQPPRIAIIDSSPQEQKLYAEFLLYQTIFRGFGWTCEIQDSKDPVKGFDLIYNRDTDFYLESIEHKHLKSHWQANDVILTPHPYEYFLLADKQRLIDWNGINFFESLDFSSQKAQTIKSHLPHGQDLTPANADECWSQRKKLFFKPKRSFGSKQSYRGDKISRKLFDEILSQDLFAQEYVPPPEITIETQDAGNQNMKYDLRFYAYQDQIQLVMARLYQGQLTNTRTPGGGFACVDFV